MTYHEPAPPLTRLTRWTLPALTLVVGAVLISLAVSTIAMPPGTPGSAIIGIDSGPPLMEEPAGYHDDHRRAPVMPLNEADGAVPAGVTVFNDSIPAVANLNPQLLGALRQAAIDASNDGVVFYVNSGWRSPGYQEQLLQDAIATYGSEAQAMRWVATAETSPHVSGDAVDIGPFEATAWLSSHGANYGLCQIYSNESWHYELRPEAIHHGCPPLYADPTHDPRMQP